jgi:hypothetical protein
MTRKIDATKNNYSTDRSKLEPEWIRAFDWIERELGIRIHAFERQPRWRPAFFWRPAGRKLPFIAGERGP